MAEKTDKNGIIYIPALDGVAPVESAISLPDTEKGMLFYRGYPIDILVEKASWEEVVYLLLFKKFPTQKSLKSFKEDLKSKQNLPDETIEMMKIISDIPLFYMVETEILSLAQYDNYLKDDSLKANYERAISLIAKTPAIIANAWRIKSGLEFKTSQKFSPLDNFLNVSNIPADADENVKRAFEVGQILCCEHELNASTLAVRTVASAGGDIYSAFAAGLCAFSGIYHGSASQFIVEMLRQIGDPANVEKWVDKKLAAENKKDRIIMGFGHRVYKGEGSDPRTTIFKKWAARLAKSRKDKILFETAEELEKYIGEKKNLCTNVDCYFALVNHFIGFPPELSPLIYAMARTVGWAAHYIEQVCDPNGRILRPRAKYIGPPPVQEWIDLENR